MKRILYPVLLSLLCLFVRPASAQQHSATLTCVQPTQPAGETVAATKVYKNGTTIATVPPMPCGFVDSTVSAGETVIYTLTNVGIDGVESIPSSAVSAVIPGAPPPPPPPPPPQSSNTFFSPTAVPGQVFGNDANRVNLGMLLSGSVPWTITAVRFYKATNSSGPHTWAIWSANGAILASGSFMGETASGWQTAMLATPLGVAAGTTIVVSYSTTQYAVSQPYFATSKTDPSGILTAPVNAGVYRYGVPNSFPNQFWQASNYWVDVIFSTTVTPPPPPPPPPTPPTIITSCAWLTDRTTWRCDTTTMNMVSGTAISTIVRSGTLSNTVTGVHP